MARLQLALGDIAHETLLRHIVRIFDSTIKLPFQKPSFQLKSGSESDKTEQEESEQEASGELKFDKHSGTIYPTDTEEADRDSFSDQLTTTEHKMSFAYKQALEEGWMPVHVLADQLLLGGVVPANSFYYVKATCKCIANAFGVALIAYAAILPAVAGTTFGGIVRTSFILFVFTNGSMMSLWYPTQLRKLFSQMSESVRMFNVMLMGRKAAGADFLPHIRVGNIDDIAGGLLALAIVLFYLFCASFLCNKLLVQGPRLANVHKSHYAYDRDACTAEVGICFTRFSSLAFSVGSSLWNSASAMEFLTWLDEQVFLVLGECYCSFFCTVVQASVPTRLRFLQWWSCRCWFLFYCTREILSRSLGQHHGCISGAQSRRRTR